VTKTPNVVLPKHLADAVLHIARVNHYLVGLASTTFDLDDLDAAEQILIEVQNAGPQKGRRYDVLDRALDLLDVERTKFRHRDHRDLKLASIIKRLETLHEMVDDATQAKLQPVITDVRSL